MSMTDNLLYAEAIEIALIGMGEYKERDGRRMKTRLRANDDPLGHWMMVEAIVDLAKRYAGQKTHEGA